METSVLGRLMGGKIDSWNLIGTKYGMEQEPSRKSEIMSAMSHEMLIFKAGIDFVLGSSPPFENQIHGRIDPHKGSILWNRCLESLKV